MYECMYECMYVCMYVCTYVRTDVCIYHTLLLEFEYFTLMVPAKSGLLTVHFVDDAFLECSAFSRSV